MQPFETDTNIMLFNGEIYNYKEIKNELISKNYKFKTESDTEVLIKAFEEYDTEVTEKIKGMYACVIFNKENNKIFFFRDKLGIKPLYYSIYKKDIIISSSIKSIQKIINPNINKLNQINFLRYGFTLGEETIYQNIKEVINGSFYSFENYKLKIKKKFEYKSLLFEDQNNDFRLSFKNNILSHSISDVEITTLKSNGYDSNLVYETSKKINNSYFYLEKNKKQIFFYKDEKIKNIFDYNDDYEKYFDEYLNILEYPTVDGFNTFLVCKAINKNNLKVCLSGLGLDEILNGYNNINKISLIRYINRFGLKNILSKFSKFKKLSFSKMDDDLLDTYLTNRSINSKETLNKDFNNNEIDEATEYSKNQLNYLFGNINGINIFNKIAIYELAFYLKNQLLKDSDFFSMVNSVELRVPYIEPEFIKSVMNRNKKFYDKNKFLNDNFNIQGLKIENKKEGFIALDFKIKNQMQNYYDLTKKVLNKF